MKYHLAQTTSAFVLMASLIPCAEAADESFMSSPPDTHNYSRPAIPEDFRPLAAPKALVPIANFSVVDAVVSNTNPALKNTDTLGGTEVGIGVSQFLNTTVVLTAFSGCWGAGLACSHPSGNAPLWRSTNDGRTWTKRFTINPPPGIIRGGVGGPADQTVDFGVTGALAGTFLTSRFDAKGDCNACNLYSARSSNLTNSPGAFNYFTVGGVAQATNHLGGVNNRNDQPWLLVGRKPVVFGENVYVAYDAFDVNFFNADVRVAAALSTDSLRFTNDNRTGFGGGGVNPGHRLAVDPRSGAVYSVFQRRRAAGAGGSQNINYMLNRSTDGGTWSLNGSPTGIVVANADSTQPRPKFCTVNALLGGADHAAMDPVTGDVVYVYGKRDSVTGNNRLAMRRLTPNRTGGLTIGPQIFITGQVQAAIPSVAITANRVIGVFYYTCDGTSRSGFPIITAHFNTSADLGTTFFDLPLLSFLSPAKDNGDGRQRVLGDFMQVKALRNTNTFYGGFAGNRVEFYPASPRSIIDPIFFRVETRGQ